MGLLHTYAADVVWTGAGETGTTGYAAYRRDHEVRVAGKPTIAGSADPAFRGDPARHNPEELLVSALAQCHMLWFLHLAATAGVVVVAYTDRATGTMRVEAAGHGQFTEAVLRPHVTVRRGPVDAGRATDATGAPGPGTDDLDLDASLADLHRQAHEHCFIARSVSFPVRTEPAPVAVEQPSA
ncbi:MAG TPA: OsmC family protein [Cellulomonas sp.]